MKSFIFLTLPLLFAGCLSPNASESPKYYQLQRADADALGTAQKDVAPSFMIIGPVEYSPYLDSPRFALRENGHEVKYLDYHRWAEPLGINVSTVIAANLRLYFDTSEISSTAPRLVARSDQKRVLMLINRFDVDTEGKAVLNVQWALTTPSGKAKEITVHEETYQQDVPEKDNMLSRVETLNQLITAFSLDMAKIIEADIK